VKRVDLAPELDDLLLFIGKVEFCTNCVTPSEIARTERIGRAYYHDLGMPWLLGAIESLSVGDGGVEVVSQVTLGLEP